MAEDATSPTGPPEGDHHGDNDCLQSLQDCRDRWSQRQANMFGALGLCIANWPWVFGLVTPLFWIGLGVGVIRAELQTDVDKLWVNFGSRTESDLDHYEATYGGLSRPHLMIFEDKNGGNALSTAHLDEIKAIDAIHLDMSPWWNPGSTCATKTTSTTCAAMGSICLWVATDTRCYDQDPYGIRPSSQLKSSILFNYKASTATQAVDWGTREVCRERPFGGFIASIARAPCSTQAWPMDCFIEPPVSLNPGVIGPINPSGSWESNHNISYADEVRRGKALAEPCKMWSGTYVPKGYIMGGVTEENGQVTHVRAFRAAQQLPNAKNMQKKHAYMMAHPASGPLMRAAGFPETITVEDAENILEGWEEAAHNKLAEVAPTLTHVRLTYLNIWGTEKVVEDASNRNSYLVVVGFALLGVVVWVYLFRCDKVYSRIGLGFAGIICIALAVLGTFGTAALFGIEFNGLTMQVLPYVTMGLGIDDMFVVIHYFHPPRDKGDIAHKMQQAYGHAGPSVLATSLVNLTVFCASIIVPVGAVRSFSYQAAIAVFVNFTMIFFGFGAYMAIDARRIAARRTDILCCMKNVDESAEAEGGPSGEEAGSPDEAAGKCLRAIADVIIGTKTGRIIVVFLAAAAVGVAGGLGCTQLELGLPLSQFVEEGSPEQAYLKARTSLLPYGSEGAVVVGGKRTGVAWNSAEVQEKLNVLFAATLNPPNSWWKSSLPGEGRSYFHEPQYLVAGPQWSLNFRQFAAEHNHVRLKYAGQLRLPGNACPADYFAPGNCVVEPDKYYELLGVWCGMADCMSTWCTSLFASSATLNASGASYCDDVILKLEWVGTKRICTGIDFHQTIVMNMPSDVSEAELSVDVMEEGRELVDELNLGLYVTGRIYLYNEQYRFTRYNLRLVLILALSVVCLILAVLFQSIVLAICQTVVIASSIVVIIAFVVALDLRLNAVTLLSIVFGVSINVELCVHIARAFDTSQHKKRSKRAAYALGEMGAPVLCGAFTTFLSVMVLAFSDTQFFRDYFFKFYSCMVVVSLVFAWTLLPALLSLFGPAPLTPFEMDREGTAEVPHSPQSGVGLEPTEPAQDDGREATSDTNGPAK